MLIDVNVLHHLAKCASKEPMRYRFDLIRLQRKNQSVELISTNSKVLARIAFPATREEMDAWAEGEPRYLDAGDVAEVCLAIKRRKLSHLRMRFDIASKEATLRGCITTGAFPTALGWRLPYVLGDSEPFFWPKEKLLQSIIEPSDLAPIGRLNPEFLAAAAQAVAPEGFSEGILLGRENVNVMLYIRGPLGLAAVSTMKDLT